MEYIKNNYKLLGAIVLLIVALFATYLQNRQEVKEIKSSTEISMHMKDSLHVRDSIAIMTLHVKFDSISSETHKIAIADVNTSVTKKGLYTVVVVTETKQPDGTYTKTSKTVTIDTSEIATSRIQSVIDSMKKESAKTVEVTKIVTVYVHDTTNVLTKDTLYKHDTSYVAKTNPVKKLELTATAGVSGNLSSSNTTISPKVIPVIGIGAAYDFAPPFFLSGGVISEGNPMNYSDWSHYKATAAIGFKIKL